MAELALPEHNREPVQPHKHRYVMTIRSKSHFGHCLYSIELFPWHYGNEEQNIEKGTVKYPQNLKSQCELHR